MHNYKKTIKNILNIISKDYLLKNIFLKNRK